MFFNNFKLKQLFVRKTRPWLGENILNYIHN